MNRVFVDVDTQYDFLLPAGALYVPGAEAIVALVVELNRHAARTGALVLSTVDAHEENDPEFAVWPPHCVRGTLGQRKPVGTLLDERMVVPADEEVKEVGGVKQIILEKQATRWSEYRNWQSAIAATGAGEFLVYGVVTEICVKSAVNDLLALGKRVSLVTDAVMHLNAEARDEFLGQLERQGGRLIRAAEALAA